MLARLARVALLPALLTPLPIPQQASVPRTCVTQFGCPAFQTAGEGLSIGPVQCIGCAVCAQVCPAGAIRPLK